MVQLAQLRALTAVLDTGSFAAAGQQVALTASAVSQQISALERSLGIRLFERRPQGIRPLAAASTLGLRATSVLVQVDLLEREAKVLASGTRGVVRVGSFPSASRRLLPETLSRVSRRRTGIDVLLDEAEPDELLHRLTDGSMDLALVYCYDMLPSTWPPGITRKPLLHESLVLLSAASAPPLAPDLSNADLTAWVSSREQTAGWRCLEQLCLQAGVTPRITYRSNDYDVVRGLVAAGLGAAVIPALAYLEDPDTLADAVDIEGAGRTVYLAYRTEDAGPLIDVLCRAFRQAARSVASDLLRPL
jgi:DNA-binding transcriptional LysR family regulator